MSCDPERVTGFVDGELDAETTAAVAAHLEACAACRAQAEAERGLRARLRGLPAPALPQGLEARVRARDAAAAPRRRARWRASRCRSRPSSSRASGSAATFRSWRGTSPGTTTSASRDARCPRRSGAASRGSWPSGSRRRAPGCRACRTASASSPSSAPGTARSSGVSLAPHVYYASPGSQVSVFVVPHGVRLADRFAGAARGTPCACSARRGRGGRHRRRARGGGAGRRVGPAPRPGGVGRVSS